MAIAHRDADMFIFDVVREDISVGDAAGVLNGISRVTGSESDGDGFDLAHAVTGVFSVLSARHAMTTLDHWRADPIAFIETVLHDPETDAPFKLLGAEKQFLRHAFQTGDDGRLRYSEQIFGAPKKSGKTGFAALHMLTMVLLFGGKYAEGYALANDLEQATSRVFQAIKRIVECSPLLRQEAKVTADKITFPAFFGATISTVASDYASAAGANPTISCFDELWAYTSERSRRLFDEMVPPPTRKIACRLTVTFAAHKHYRSAARTGHVPTILLATVSLHGHPNCIIRPLIIADRATLP